MLSHKASVTENQRETFAALCDFARQRRDGSETSPQEADGHRWLLCGIAGERLLGPGETCQLYAAKGQEWGFQETFLAVAGED